MTSKSDERRGAPCLYHHLDALRKEIRVLQLQPGQWHDTVEGDFVVFQLSNRDNHLQPEPNVPYEAISYTWWDADSRDEMVINGQHWNVLAGAVEVLRYLRSSEQSAKFWIDAICINQSDFDERAQQLAMMGDIYMDASQTRIWLGPASELTAAATRLCLEIRREVDAALIQRGSRLLDRWDSIRQRMQPSDSTNNYQMLKSAIESVDQHQPLDIEVIV